VSEQQSDEERTEEPTEKRRREFREKGQVAQSKEINTALLLSAALLLWSFYAPVFWKRLQDFLAGFWRNAGTAELEPGNVHGLFITILEQLALLFWPLFLLALVGGFLAGFVQFGWLFTLKPLQPDFSKLDPIKGAQKFVSKRSAVEVAKSMSKVFVVAALAYYTLYQHFEEAILLLDQGVGKTLAFIGHIAGAILIKCCAVLIVLAVLDFLFVRWEMEQKMKMTKKELQDEHKETEGDPQQKQKMRSIQKQMASKRMMAEVPSSDVVITNPTHVAVALAYDRGTMDAPEVVAKGTDYIALQIKKVAQSNSVPVVHNPPVARTLNELELGEAIPEEMYKAVAEIFVHIYKLKGKGNQ
jgi:flagellar biosynthetic protein FlhB